MRDWPGDRGHDFWESRVTANEWCDAAQTPPGLHRERAVQAVPTSARRSTKQGFPTVSAVTRHDQTQRDRSVEPVQAQTSAEPLHVVEKVALWFANRRLVGRSLTELHRSHFPRILLEIASIQARERHQLPSGYRHRWF